MASANPYKLFSAVLQRTSRLSPHLLRITFAGPEIANMAT